VAIFGQPQLETTLVQEAGKPNFENSALNFTEMKKQIPKSIFISE